jgi:hypothetical protein
MLKVSRPVVYSATATDLAAAVPSSTALQPGALYSNVKDLKAELVGFSPVTAVKAAQCNRVQKSDYILLASCSVHARYV